MSNTKDDVDIEKLYGQECFLSKDDFVKAFKVDENRSFF